MEVWGHSGENASKKIAIIREQHIVVSLFDFVFFWVSARRTINAARNVLFKSTVELVDLYIHFESVNRKKASLQNTDRRNVTPLYFPDSTNTASLKGLTLRCSEIKPIKTAIGKVMHDFHGLNPIHSRILKTRSGGGGQIPPPS